MDRMTANRCGVIFVCGPDRRLVGVVSDGDVRRALRDTVLTAAPVGKLMNTDPIVARDEAEAVDLVREFRAVAVPVVDHDGCVHAIAVARGSAVDVVRVVRVDDRPDAAPRTGSAVAIIPARGGSKRLPRKNLAPLRGRSLVARAVDAALDSAHVGHVVVSTDDEAIADEARRAGATVPWLRPAALGADDTPSIAVVDHALAWALASLDPAPTIGLLLEPTAPLRPKGLVDQVVEALLREDADSAATVCEVPHTLHPDEQLVIASGALEAFAPGSTVATRRLRAEQEPCYVFSGQVYAFRPATVLDGGSLFGARCVPVERPWHEYVDIDTEADLQQAEWVLARHGLT